MNIPYVLDSCNNSERVYDLYSKLLNNRIIFLQGEIDDRVSALVTSELLYLDSINNDDIKLYINSPGGSVTGGLAIYDTMNHIKSDVVTIGTGLCASMGAFLLSSGQKGKRYVLPNTEVMIHQPASMASGQATEIRIAAGRFVFRPYNPSFTRSPQQVPPRAAIDSIERSNVPFISGNANAHDRIP